MMLWISKKKVFLAVLIVLSVFFLSLHLAVALRPSHTLMMWFHIDDAYYYFQVARHAVEGRGFTFDGIGLSNGFHPLWMLVNLPVFYLARFNPFLPFRVLVLVSALITLSGGWLLFDLLRKEFHLETALLGFTIWLFFWPTYNLLTETGMETGLNAFMLVLFLWAIPRTRWGASRAGFLWLGAAAAGVLAARLDNLFLVILFGLWLVFHQRPMRHLILLDVLAWFITVFTSLILRVGIDARLGFITAAEIFFAALVVIRSATCYALGLYRDPHAYSVRMLLFRLTAAIGISSAALFLLVQGLMSFSILQSFPRSAIFIESALALVLTGLVRIGFRLGVSGPSNENLSFRTQGRTWLKSGLLYLLPVVAFLSAYLFWNQQTFGTPMPISGQIKQWWGTLLTVYGRKHSSFWTLFGILPNTREAPQPWFLIQRYLFQPIYTLFGVDPFTQKLPYLAVKLTLAALFGGGWVALSSRHSSACKHNLHHLSIAPLLAAAIFLPLYYAFTGYQAMREWYWVPQILVTLMLFLTLTQLFVNWLEKQTYPLKHLQWLPLALCMLLPLTFSIKIIQRFPLKPDDAQSHDSLDITHYLETQTPEGSLIGMTGGGTEAYFIQGRTIINLDGLINSKAYFDLLRAGQGAQYLDQIGLDYVLGQPEVLFHSDPYAWTFTDRLQKIDTFKKYTLFSYVDN